MTTKNLPAAKITDEDLQFVTFFETNNDVVDTSALSLTTPSSNNSEGSGEDNDTRNDEDDDEFMNSLLQDALFDFDFDEDGITEHLLHDQITDE